MERISGVLKSWRKQGNIFLMFFVVMVSVVHAQNKQIISGKVIDGNNLPIPFASVVLCADSVAELPSNVGTMSNEKGIFNLGAVQPGMFKLLVSSVGYKPVTELLEVKAGDVTDAGEIVLSDSVFLINEAVVVGERIRGKSESDRTIFYVNKKILDVAGTGTDVLKYIPGVQVDLKQNITLEGSSNILIYVNGIERSKSYVSQLNPMEIDKVEIIDTPSSGYDSNVTGVINIIMKKEKNTGVSGHAYMEVPTSKSEIFLFPSMSFNYGFKKLNLYLSYNGEINYENIDECVFREKRGNGTPTNISSVQDVRQQNISNKFHYGLDYFLNDKNQVNFYGFCNPYSYEQSGNASVKVSGEETSNWSARRIENDRNKGFFNSLYYKHIFHDNGSEITFDISNFYLDARNSISFISTETGPESKSYFNTQNPKQNAFSAKSDLILPLGDRLILNAGVKAKNQKMEDNSSERFSYTEKIFAAYSTH